MREAWLFPNIIITLKGNFLGVRLISVLKRVSSGWLTPTQEMPKPEGNRVKRQGDLGRKWHHWIGGISRITWNCDSGVPDVSWEAENAKSEGHPRESSSMDNYQWWQHFVHLRWGEEVQHQPTEFCECVGQARRDGFHWYLSPRVGRSEGRQVNVQHQRAMAKIWHSRICSQEEAQGYEKRQGIFCLSRPEAKGENGSNLWTSTGTETCFVEKEKPG